MKKLRNSLLASTLVLSFALFTPGKSHALIGGAGSSFTVASALYMAAGGASFYGSAKLFELSKNMQEGSKTSSRVLAFLMMLGGVLLLDSDSEGLEFPKVEGEIESMILEKIDSVNADDIATYNSESETLNAILASAEYTEMRKDGDLSQNDVLMALNSVGDAVSPSTLKVAGLLSGIMVESKK